jgi:hypothetical protein
MRGKLPGDDFYCWRFQVWYRSLDCATRTAYHTAPGCRDCSQGDHNLALWRTEVRRIRPPRPALGFADAPDVDPSEDHLPAAG